MHGTAEDKAGFPPGLPRSSWCRSDQLLICGNATRKFINSCRFLTSTEIVTEIANDAATVWGDLLTTAVGIQSEPAQRQHVRSVMTENGCLPSQVIDRLTQTRIRPGD